MKLTAEILLVFFGLIAIHGWLRIFGGSNLNWFHTIIWVISMIITAFSAGIIWGGLIL